MSPWKLMTIFLVLMCCLACSKSDLLSRLTDKSKPWDRSQAIDDMHKLSMVEQQQLVPALINKLSDGNRYVRQNAAEALGGLDEYAKEAVPFLKTMSGDDNKELSLVARVSLARMGHDTKETLGILIDRLKDQSEKLEAKLNRYSAANSIGFIASGSCHPDVTIALPALVLALHDSDQSVRERTAWAIGSAGEQADRVVDALKETAWKDSSRNVRYLASWALKQVGTAAAKDALEGWVLTDKD